MKKKTVSIITLGCRVNQYESCAMADALTQLGFIVNKQGISDYYIINTCAVTAESERKSRQTVRRYAAKGKVLVTGCASQLDQSFSDIENVIYVCGNRNKMSVVDMIYSDLPSRTVCVEPMDDAEYEDMFLLNKNDLFSECRAFVKIQDGCNGKCTYCIIPKCRGPIRSRSSESIIEEGNRLAQLGYKEIILTGIETGAYNHISLYELIKRLSQIKGIERIRLGSLSPKVISDKFLGEVSAIGSFMPHVHLSLQSCNDNVLKAMARPYRKKDIINRVAALRKYIPDCMISADIIVGFPGETEEDFLETVETLKELKIFHIHSFPYSERKGTPAAEMENSVPKHIRTDRNNRLINACSDIRKEILDSFKGKNVSLLVEKIKDGMAFGHTKEFLESAFPAENVKVGDIVGIEISHHDGERLIGNLIGGYN